MASTRGCRAFSQARVSSTTRHRHHRQVRSACTFADQGQASSTWRFLGTACHINRPQPRRAAWDSVMMTSVGLTAFVAQLILRNRRGRGTSPFLLGGTATGRRPCPPTFPTLTRERAQRLCLTGGRCSICSPDRMSTATLLVRCDHDHLHLFFYHQPPTTIVMHPTVTTNHRRLYHGSYCSLPPPPLLNDTPAAVVSPAELTRNVLQDLPYRGANPNGA